MAAYVEELGRRDEVAELIERHFQIVRVLLPDDQADRDFVIHRGSPIWDYEQAATAASATAWSCSPLPPLTPTAPAIWPFTLIGRPPAKIITRPWFDAWMPKNWSPGWLLRPSSRVEISKAFAVKALLMA